MPLKTEKKVKADYGRLAFNPIDYRRVFVANVWYICLMVAAAAAASFLFSINQKQVYEATGTISISRSANELLAVPTTLNQLVGGGEFKAALAKQPALARYPVEKLTAGLNISQVKGKPLITVTALAADADQAKQLANGAAAVLLDRIGALDLVEKQLAVEMKTVEKQLFSKDNEAPGLVAQIAQLRRDLAKLEETGVSPTEKTLRSMVLSQQIISLEMQKQQLIGARQNLRLETLRLGRSQLLEPARIAEKPVKTGVLKNTLIAAVAALIAGTALVLAFTMPPPTNAGLPGD